MNESIVLLVEPDLASQRVMEVSLKKVGFTVHSAASLQEAISLSDELQPQLILADAQLPDGNGYDLCGHVRSSATLRHCGVIIMSEQTDPQARIAAITAGADEFMRKPVRVKEIVSRATALIERQAYTQLTELDSSRNFSGTLEDIGLVDLLQLVESGKKTCIIHLASDPKQSGGFAEANESGRIYCRDGDIIDAELKRLSGADAIYRFMLWDNGVFEIESTPLGRENIIRISLKEVIVEGMRQVDQWTKIRDLLPSLSIPLDVDYTTLSETVDELPEEVESLIRLFDGKRNTRDVLNETSILDLPALESISRLYVDGVLFDRRTRPSLPPARGSSVSLNAWLSSAPEPRKSLASVRPSTAIPGLPSVLGRAMIPAVDTPSQILRPMTIDSGFSSPSLPLPGEDEPILLTDSSRKRIPSDAEARPLSQPVVKQTARPRTLTAPPAVEVKHIAAPPPAPVRTVTTGNVPLVPANSEAETVQMPAVPAPSRPVSATPAPVAPPSSEFASPRVVQSSGPEEVETALAQQPRMLEPNAPPSPAHQREDTADRFFSMYDENAIEEAAGVSHRGNQAMMAVAGLIVIGLIALQLSKSDDPSAESVATKKVAPVVAKVDPKPAAKEASATASATLSTDKSETAAKIEKAGAKPEAVPATAKAEKVETKPQPVQTAAKQVTSNTPAPAKKVAKPVKKVVQAVKTSPPPKAKKTLPRKKTKKADDPEVLDRLSQGENALENKDLGAAEAAFRKVVKLSPKNAKAHSGLSLTLVSRGKTKAGMASARKALKLSKYRDARAYMALGLGYGELEQDKKAIKALKRFLKLAPNHPRADEIESFIEALSEEE